MRVEKETGSIAPGKRADLVLLDGDRSRHSRRAQDDVVVCRGIVYDPAELFATAG